MQARTSRAVWLPPRPCAAWPAASFAPPCREAGQPSHRARQALARALHPRRCDHLAQAPLPPASAPPRCAPQPHPLLALYERSPCVRSTRPEGAAAGLGRRFCALALAQYARSRALLGTRHAGPGQWAQRQGSWQSLIHHAVEMVGVGPCGGGAMPSSRMRVRVAARYLAAFASPG